ncbi:MAG: potassium-transporting ATPase subunit KdpC [Microbacteriaceae bacterium]|nr:potassium-transporting ATPase subunit KdpC [Microbacteriaceae bacterium]MCL2793942.1 potassium-transporting ATPase subunit KdpC [Microbacteriaceae bacterium]
MATSPRATVRQYWVAIRAMIVLTVALGILYPLVITGIGQLAFRGQANGSTITGASGRDVGSSLIAQSFSGKDGAPLTQWFQPRPSAVDFDANGSGGSNLGPNNPDLVKAIDARKKVIEQTYGVTAAQIPADAVTASFSGLDPDVSIAYADLQVAKVAQTRGLPVAQVQKLVAENTHGRDLGYLGDAYVNVVTLNAALAKMDPSGNGE